jgi:xylitol oxidase
VSAIELVTANGDLVTLSRTQNKEDFEGAVVGLGAVGVVNRMTLDIAPAFSMQQEVYEFVPTDLMEANFDAITSAAYSVSFFTEWKPESVNQIWLKRRLADSNGLALEPTFFGGKLAAARIAPVAGSPSDHCNDQEGIVGSWNERLTHFRLDHIVDWPDELQSEYFVPREHAIPAMRLLIDLQPQYDSFTKISELRTVAADRLWLSPSYEQPIVCLHFSWRKRWDEISKFLPILEAGLAPYRARPHWGKLFIMSPAHVQSLYPRMGDFRDLLQRYDPTGKFRNPFIDHYIFG